MDHTLEQHYLAQIEGLRADVRYWKRRAAQASAPKFNFYDDHIYGLLLSTDVCTAWRHFENNKPGLWSIDFNSEICKLTGFYSSINAVVDDFGNLVKVD